MNWPSAIGRWPHRRFASIQPFHGGSGRQPFACSGFELSPSPFVCLFALFEPSASAARLVNNKRRGAGIGRQWFEDLEPLGVSGGAFNLRAHTTVHRDYLRRVCSEAFNDAARTVSGHLLSVRFLGPQEEAPPAENGRPKSGGKSGLAGALPRVLPSSQIEPRPAAPGDVPALGLN